MACTEDPRNELRLLGDRVCNFEFAGQEQTNLNTIFHAVGLVLQWSIHEDAPVFNREAGHFVSTECTAPIVSLGLSECQ